MDKRIIKTRTSIKKAFIELVEEKSINKISVSDLAAKALVNRSTFYLHYADVASVAEDIDREIEKSISECFEGFSISDIYASTYLFFKKLTARLDENEAMKRYIIFSTNCVHVISNIKLVLVEKTTCSLLRKFPQIDAQKLTYPLTYAAGGIMDCYVNWVKSGEGTIPIEVMKDVSAITEYIISYLTNNLTS